jgi:beta-glucosidase-like glycosyl hydrolase
VLSRRIVAGRLRSFFKGVIISDAIEVPALQRYGSRVAVMAANAGVDVLLYTSTNAGGAFDAMLGAHRRGDLSSKRLQASHKRIMALKEAVATNGAQR